MNWASNTSFILLIFFVQGIRAGQELIACSDKKTSSKISLEYDFENRSFVVSGKTLRTAKHGDKAKLHEFAETFPIYSDSSTSAFPGYDPRGGDVCKTLSLSILNPDNTDWKKCQEGLSQLEWMGKYSGGKAEEKNRQSDMKRAKYQDLIRGYCPKFDGKLSGVWVSVANGEKMCDRIGINVSEFAAPLMYSSQDRLQGLFQNSFSVACKYDAIAINRLANTLNAR